MLKNKTYLLRRVWLILPCQIPRMSIVKVGETIIPIIPARQLGVDSPTVFESTCWGSDLLSFFISYDADLIWQSHSRRYILNDRKKYHFSSVFH